MVSTSGSASGLTGRFARPYGSVALQETDSIFIQTESIFVELPRDR